MNRKELIDTIATRTASSKADTERNVSALIEIISSTLTKVDSVALAGFGTIEVHKSIASPEHLPATGAPLKSKASKAPVLKTGAPSKRQ